MGSYEADDCEGVDGREVMGSIVVTPTTNDLVSLRLNRIMFKIKLTVLTSIAIRPLLAMMLCGGRRVCCMFVLPLQPE